MKGKRIIALLLSVFMVLSMFPTAGLDVMTVEAASKPKLAKKKASVVIGGTARIKVKNAPKGAKFTYKSKKKAVATVSKKGRVKGVKSGTATIIVSVKKNAKTTKLKYRVTVKKPQLSNGSLSMTPGKRAALSVKNKPKKAKYTWSSGNPQIAAVNKNGEVTAIAKGSTTIKAKVKTAKKTYQLSCRITVTDSSANEKPGSGSAPELTVSNFSETETNHVETETVNISGTAGSGSGTVKEVTYSLRFTLDEKASVTGKAEGTTKWTIKALPLQIGTSFLTITAVDSEKRQTQKVITLNRLSTKITLAENVVAYTEEESADIAGDIIDYWTDDMGTEENTLDDQTIVVFSERSEIVKSIKNGLIEAGDVVMLQPCAELYLGFNGVYLSNGEAEDAKKYPPEEYEILSFRAADYTDIFEGDVSISYELADLENILAFAYFPSEVDIYAQDDDGNQLARLYSNAKSSSEEYGDQSKKQEISQPGFQKNALSYMMNDAWNITGGVSSEKGVNIGLKFKDTVLFDEDGKAGTTDDQLKFGGSLSFEQLNVDAGIEWHPDFNPFSLDLLPQQIIAKYSYTEKIDAHADWTGKLSLDDVKDSDGNKVGLVKAANKLLNNDFENDKKFLGMTLSGVDMSDSIILGAFGLQIAPTSLATVVGIKNAQYTSVFVPLSAVIVIMPVIDINGELSAKVGLTYKYTSYNENGINMQKKDFVGAYGSLSENRGQSSKDLGFDRSLEIYDVCSKSSTDKKSDPAWSLTLEGDGKAKAKIAVGADIGVMVSGIIPASAEGKLYASTEVEGKTSLSVDNEKGLTEDALAKVDSRVGVMAEAHFKLAIASSVASPEITGDAKWDKVLWEAHLTSAYLDGTISKAADSGNEMGDRSTTKAGNDETIADAAVTLTRIDQVGKPTWITVSDEEGKYRFDDVADGKYIITVSKEGYKTYESDEIEMSGTHKTVNVTLEVQKTGETDNPGDDSWDTNPDTSGLYTYSLNQEVATITGYKGTETDLNLPTSIDGYKVVGIAASAFKDNKTLVSVNIPETIVNLGCKETTTWSGDSYYGIFQGDESLERVTIQEGKEEGYIGNKMFQGCVSLQKIEVPGNIKTIYGRAFENCKAMTSFTWSKTTGVAADQTIEEYAFNAASELANVRLNSVTSIGVGAFLGNAALKNLTLNEGLQTIGGSAFKDCVVLEEVRIPSTAVNLGCKETTTWSGDNYYGVFQGDERLERVTMQAGRQDGYIGNKMFQGCVSLQEIEVPGNIKTIYGRAFENCKAMTSFTWLKTTGVTADQTIEEYAFNAASELTAVSLNSVTSIGAGAFLGNAALKNLTLNEGLQTIGGSAFKDCVVLEEVRIPGTAVNLGYKETSTWSTDSAYGVFQGDERLARVTMQAGRQDGYIGNKMFQGCVSLQEIEVPGNIKTIYGRAFENCKAMTSFTWSKTTGVAADQTIEVYAFKAASELETVSLNSVTSIGVGAFLGNAALKNLTLNEGLQTIGGSAFKDCVALEEVRIPGTAVNLGYKETSTWSTDSAYGVFQGDERLARVTMQAGRQDGYIGNKMFQGCVSLQEIEVPGNIKTIYGRAFENCKAMTSFTWSKTTGVAADQTIEVYAFKAASELAAVSLNSVTSIGVGAFLGNAALKNLTLNEGLQTIGGSAFKDCVALEEVRIPSTAVNLGYKETSTWSTDSAYGVFQGDIKLKRVTIKSGQELSGAYIGNKMFYGCTSLSNITFEQGAMTMYGNCFGNVTATVYYPASQSTWTSDLMQDYGGTITWVAR